jgi:hypothetical protein
MVNHSRFQKKPIDPSFEVIDNGQKFLFNKRLNECKLRCLLELNQCNGNKQYTMPCVFLSKNIQETNSKLIGFSRNVPNSAFEQQELESVKRSAESISNAARSDFNLPRYAGESCRTSVDGNEILDILLSKAAFDLKYETDE